MASVGTGAVRIIDNDNDVVSVTNNKLDVNATLVAGASIDIGDVEILGHGAVAHGTNYEVGTSAEVLTSSTPCKHVDIMADVGNTGKIFVGGSGVTSNTGICLYPGDVYSIDISNLNLLYVMSTVSNEDVQWVVYN